MLASRSKLLPAAVALPSVAWVQQDLIGGQIDLACVDPFAAYSFITSGEVKAMALVDADRSAALPQVSTTAQLGVPEVCVLTWAALFTPAVTPLATIAFLNHEITAILGSPVAHNFITRQGGHRC